ncbi:MAG: restriction endonuclease-like protein [Vallitaleaceae bacterium]|nr:restriction endonuclease-like protein [Vallitaleaceae bacterium]
MDTLLTGSSVSLSKEQELICIENATLALTIKGKASHPNSNIESLETISGVKAILAADDFSVSVFPEHKETIHGKILVKKIKPLFYEQRNYEICIEYIKVNPNDRVIFWHENINIREKVTTTGKLNQEKISILSGVINFGNEIGYSSLSVRVNDKEQIRLEIEVFPAKLDYQKDYQAMLHDVTDEVYNLAFDFMKKTYQKMNLVDKHNNSNSEFFSIITLIYDHFLHAVDMIIANAHHELEIYSEKVPVHKVKRIDQATMKWMAKHPEKAYRTTDGKVYFESVQATKKRATYDTYENRFVKFILLSISRRLDNIKSTYSKVVGNGRKKDVEIINQLNKMMNQIYRRTEFSFFSQVGNLSDNRSMSLVFAMTPGYKEIYKYFLMLKKGLSLHGELFHMSMKETALLYEYWCFIKLNQILKSGIGLSGQQKYHLVKQDVLKVDQSGLSVTLKKGAPSKVEYLNPTNGEKIELSYNPKVSTLPTITQKPDNILSLLKRENGRKYEYVFDAKYRVNMAVKGSDYERDFRTPGPEVDTINAMHRYRDAIVCGNGMDKPYERRMYGAYVLFPYDDETKYKDHKFYQSIETMNIGGLPFLPGTTTLVEKFLDELILDSADSAFERATLPSGIEEKLERVNLKDRNVLVGLLNEKEQLAQCLKNKFYHIPAKLIADDSFPFEYVAIHQTKELFGKDAGIMHYGKIKKYSRRKRSDIKEIPVSRRNNGDELYYYFEIIEWIQLEQKIEVDRMRRSYYTNIHLLENCSNRPELSLTSIEQLRLYKELKRLSDSVIIKDDNNIINGFEFNGSYISFDGNEITVLSQSGKINKYKAAYWSKSMKATFNEIKVNVDCE